MILLNGHSLTPARKIPLETMSLELKERDSSATITPADMTGIQVNSWVKDEGEPGDGIVWRVRSIQETFATNTPKVQLEHVINTLKDTVLFGEIKPADITGNPKATTCTAEQAVRFILRKQNDWVLGSFGYAVSNPYKFDGDSLFDALETVSSSLSGAWWSYDFSVYPFRLNINMASNREESELRAGRNLRSISRTVDKNGMYTRFYPIGKDDLHIDGDFMDMHTDLYGVVAKVESDSNIDDKAELRRWATERLAIHAQPSVTIDVEGLELADATGVSLDRLTLGAYCRVPLPEYNTTISERIVSLSYQDKVQSPEVVKITLANNQEDVTKIIADAIKKSGRGGRASARQAKEDHAWFEDTNNHVAMCAEGIVGVDAQGNPNWARLSQIIVNENGIEATVRGVQNGLEIANTKITQNENAITLEARRAQTQEGYLSSRITVEADRITTEVSQRKSGQDALTSRITQTATEIRAEVVDSESRMTSRITQNSNKISLVVDDNNNLKTASIVAGINDQAGSYVKISADKINLSGYVTASQLAATQADIDNLMAGNTVATALHATTVNTSVLKVANSQASWKLANIPGYGYLNYLGA